MSAFATMSADGTDCARTRQSTFTSPRLGIFKSRMRRQARPHHLAGQAQLIEKLGLIARDAPRQHFRLFEPMLENLRRVGNKHPQFPRTDDMIAYQANFHAETLQGLASA